MNEIKGEDIRESGSEYCFNDSVAGEVLEEGQFMNKVLSNEQKHV